MSTLLGTGAYTIADASRLTKLRANRVREWFSEAHVFPGDYRDSTVGQMLISFSDLVEVYVAGQLRNHGIGLQTIRKVHVALRDQWNDAHPFCRKELRTSGKSVFSVGLDEHGKEEIREILTRQRVFADFIAPFLKSLDYHEVTASAIRWKIAAGVEIDPGICFGQPIAATSKIPTVILSNAYHANGQQLEAVARWYGVSTDDVSAAVAFESNLVA